MNGIIGFLFGLFFGGFIGFFIASALVAGEDEKNEL